ncbi:potassium uptake protein TrkA [Prevotella sp. CAG:891]|jgi:AspT/YidE/YbjL antiporter-like protein|nr:putative transporter [Prevotellamassilia sp.]CDE86276.1 potassium uptake protein TrkA [Prevotella sp. CAG:891]
MDWLTDTLFAPTAVQAVIVICLICALGLALGNIRFRGVSLGVTYVFFIGILAGALGLQVDSQMLSYAESFGLILFVYTLGLQVGPGFVSAFRQGGTQLNLLAVGVVLIGTLMALVTGWTGLLSLQDMMGVLCGATTNTPALGAAQQTLKQLGQPASGAALSCAVTYPLGMVGVILAFIVVRGWLTRHEKSNETESANTPFIASFLVCNPAVFGHTLGELSVMDEKRFIVSRLWREGRVILPNAQTKIEQGDRLLVITTQKQVTHLTIFFGQIDETNWNRKDVDWNALDSNLISQRILITRPEINGRHLGALQLRNRYGVNVSRVQRSGIQLVATPDLVLRMGDRVTVVGEAQSIAEVAKELGNVVKRLDEPNMITIFIGIVMGLLLGSIPLFVPGMDYPVKLGLAGGPIVMGILIGAFGPRFHMVAYTTTSANLMMRSLGLSMYLACLGLDAGKDFLTTVMQPSALWWIGIGFAFTIVPVVIMSIVSVVVSKKTFATTAGMLCGAMANPIALGYVNDTQPGDKASVAYATVYPLCMFLRVIIAQVIVMLWL